MENHYNCVYCFTNKINGKKYVGQTKNFNKRYKEHSHFSENKNKNYDSSSAFHNAINKYGISNFKYEILKEDLQTQCLLNFWECYYITNLNTLAKNNKGYNISSGSSNGNPWEGKTEKEKDEIRKK